MGGVSQSSWYKRLAVAALAVASGARGQEVESVLQMTKENADSIFASEDFVLVKFYAPWCGHCKAMAADYQRAAATAKAEDLPVVLAEVDATVQSELASKFKVEGYPTLYWFVKGAKTEYTGPRDAEGIIAWLKDNMGPAVKTYSSSEIGDLIKNRKWSTNLVVGEGDESLQKKLNDVALNTTHVSIAFVETSASPSITVYKGTEETASYSGDYEVENIDAWLKTARVPAFGQINEDNFEIYLEQATSGLFWVCLDPESLSDQLKKYSSSVVTAYQKVQSTMPEFPMPFVWLDVAEFESHAREELGCNNYPTIVLQKGNLMGEDPDMKVEKYIRSFSDVPNKFNVDAIVKFFQDVSSGGLEAVQEPDELDKLDEVDADDDDDELGDLDDHDDLKEEL
ncbi:unnamed protein product [Amoebophrya sp. A25]|nr:unnamed protein product [Amoebophrya sp. A25]|eukprot:GSA25T00014924001.1